MQSRRKLLKTLAAVTLIPLSRIAAQTLSDLQFTYAEKYAEVQTRNIPETEKSDQTKSLMESYERALRRLQTRLTKHQETSRAKAVEDERRNLKRNYDRLIPRTQTTIEKKEPAAKPPEKQKTFDLLAKGETNCFKIPIESRFKGHRLSGEEETSSSLDLYFQLPYKQPPRKATLCFQVGDSKRAGTTDEIAIYLRNLKSNGREPQIGYVIGMGPNQKVQIPLDTDKFPAEQELFLRLRSDGKDVAEIKKNSSRLQLEYR
jgi:hypothetical protein